MVRRSIVRRGMDRRSMDRRISGFLFVLAILALFALSGCVGKSTSNAQNGGVQTVTLNPSSTVSLELGGTQSFSATARDSAGRTVFTTIQFVAECVPDSPPCAPISFNNSGLACAGSWDPAFVVCTPGVVGVAQVTAIADGVSSVPAKVYVHQHIQSLQAAAIGTPANDCFSQAVTSNFQATAYSANNVDITSSVGPINWSVATGNVLTIDTVKDLPNNQVQVTAKDPGTTQLFASVSGTTSAPVNYITCPVSFIKLEVQNGSGNSFSIAAGGTKTILATAVDVLGVTLSKPPLTWSTSNPEIATVSSSGVVTGRQNAGAANISASCTPPTCNIGFLPGLEIYSTGGTLPSLQPGFGVITANVTNTKPPTATAWAATTDCNNAFDCTSAMFSVTTANNPIGSSVVLPFTPNSMIFNPGGTRAYLGSDSGLMFVDLGGQSPTVSTVSQQTTPCNVAVCGKPLTISADGNRVVISDTTTVPNQVYIFDAAHATNAPVDLLLDGAIAASFSPDQLKIFILTNAGKLFVYSTVDSLLSVPIAGPVTDLAFAADGSFAYVAGSPGNAVSGVSTCNIQDIGASPALTANPSRVFALPHVQEAQIIDLDHSVITQNILTLVPPNLQFLTAQFTRDKLADPNKPPNPQFECNAPRFHVDPPQYTGFTAGATINLGQGTFTPLYMQVTGDATKVIIVAENIPAVLVVDLNSGTTSAVPLANNPSPLAASATQDGTQVFVAACDADHANPNTCGSVHIVNLQTGGDIQQAVFTNPNTNDSMCSNLPGTTCIPNLIAVRPQ